MVKKTSDVSVWRKFTLSPEEASEYFGIGINKIRKIIANNKMIYKTKRKSLNLYDK